MFYKKNKNKPDKKRQKENSAKEFFNFGLIEYYFRNKDHSSAFQVIEDKTLNDIDFYELFMQMDKTSSKIGQQYLFDKLLTIQSKVDFGEPEKLIHHFIENEDHREITSEILSKLNKREAYYIANLFLDEYIKRPKWFWVIKMLSALSVLTLILSLFVFNKLIFLLLILFVVNIIIHYWNKNNIMVYMDSIPQLLVLCKNVKKLLKLNLSPQSDNVVASVKSIDKLKNKLSVFSFEIKAESDFLALLLIVVENIKILFLIEPLIVFSAVKKLDEKRDDIRIMYEYFGEIDCALSVALVRMNAPFYCKPVWSDDFKCIEFSDIYHPMIPDCVANSLNVNGKSILLTGSNMAGKTTFIRTIAINSLLAQTINTCFARSLKMTPMKLFSAIRISDDLLNDKSYYFEEVLMIREMIRESQSQSANLFLLDEIFKGTNTIERIAAGKAVLSYLCQSNNIVFVSTHDIELTELLCESYDLYHFTELVEDDHIHFDYKLKPGNLKTRNAIRILEINDYPKEIIEEARKISGEHQKQI